MRSSPDRRPRSASAPPRVVFSSATARGVQRSGGGRLTPTLAPAVIILGPTLLAGVFGLCRRLLLPDDSSDGSIAVGYAMEEPLRRRLLRGQDPSGPNDDRSGEAFWLQRVRSSPSPRLQHVTRCVDEDAGGVGCDPTAQARGASAPPRAPTLGMSRAVAAPAANDPWSSKPAAQVVDDVRLQPQKRRAQPQLPQARRPAAGVCESEAALSMPQRLQRCDSGGHKNFGASGGNRSSGALKNAAASDGCSASSGSIGSVVAPPNDGHQPPLQLLHLPPPSTSSSASNCSAALRGRAAAAAAANVSRLFENGALLTKGRDVPCQNDVRLAANQVRPPTREHPELQQPAASVSRLASVPSTVMAAPSLSSAPLSAATLPPPGCATTPSRSSSSGRLRRWTTGGQMGDSLRQPVAKNLLVDAALAVAVETNLRWQKAQSLPNNAGGISRSLHSRRSGPLRPPAPTTDAGFAVAPPACPPSFGAAFASIPLSTPVPTAPPAPAPTPVQPSVPLLAAASPTLCGSASPVVAASPNVTAPPFLHSSPLIPTSARSPPMQTVVVHRETSPPRCLSPVLAVPRTTAAGEQRAVHVQPAVSPTASMALPPFAAPVSPTASMALPPFPAPLSPVQCALQSGVPRPLSPGPAVVSPVQRAASPRPTLAVAPCPLSPLQRSVSPGSPRGGGGVLVRSPPAVPLSSINLTAPVPPGVAVPLQPVMTPPVPTGFGVPTLAMPPAATFPSVPTPATQHVAAPPQRVLPSEAKVVQQTEVRPASDAATAPKDQFSGADVCMFGHSFSSAEDIHAAATTLAQKISASGVDMPSMEATMAELQRSAKADVEALKERRAQLLASLKSQEERWRGRMPNSHPPTSS